MTLPFLIFAWAVMEFLQEGEVPPRLISPAVLLSYFREAGEILLLLFFGAGIFYSARLHFAASPEFLAAAGVLFFYLYSRAARRKESSALILLAAALTLAQEGREMIWILRQSVEIAAGVTGIRFLLRGFKKREHLFPLPGLFSGLPGFFVTAALISLILFPLFIP